MRRKIIEASRLLKSGQLSASSLLESCLQAIDTPAGERERAFKKLYRTEAREAAKLANEQTPISAAAGPQAGIPVSIKDLFDVAGETTSAISRIFDQAPPVKKDAAVIARLKAAGAPIIGRTNMSELAFTGIGTNPHFGTPLNPFDRARGRIPRGASSGAAVSVTDGMCLGAIASDTDGSKRTPAALCGLVGFKPTSSFVPMDGVFPLSPSLDSIGSIARTLSCCVRLFEVISGTDCSDVVARPLAGLRLLQPDSYLLEGLDANVAEMYDSALSRLTEVGAKIHKKKCRALDRIPTLRTKGGYPAVEAYAALGYKIRQSVGPMDEFVRRRVFQGKTITSQDVADLDKERALLRAELEVELLQFDAVVVPTVPCIAPAIAESSDIEHHEHFNALLLRNTSWVNLLDGCAITIPCHQDFSPSVGLTIALKNGADKDLISIAYSVERVLVSTHN